MAKEIKVTFKKEEEYLYNYIMEQGKGKFLKELIKSLLENKDISIPSNNNVTSDKNDLMDKLEKMQLDILEIKNKLSSKNKVDNVKPKAEIEDNNVGISKNFNIDDLS